MRCRIVSVRKPLRTGVPGLRAAFGRARRDLAFVCVRLAASRELSDGYGLPVSNPLGDAGGVTGACGDRRGSGVGLRAGPAAPCSRDLAFVCVRRAASRKVSDGHGVPVSSPLGDAPESRLRLERASSSSMADRGVPATGFRSGQRATREVSGPKHSSIEHGLCGCSEAEPAHRSRRAWVSRLARIRRQQRAVAGSHRSRGGSDSRVCS